ncbi:MAG: adenylate/guanylate cyclase domain-containing protein, partial [Candidatus Marinimicrobia bacterium]|nr:adenylate/guanylate cyclase domain-containing protein [Candidatus Neomarinimicrobiota bacterium]
MDSRISQLLNLRTITAVIGRALDRSVENASPFMTAAAILGFAAHPVFYIIWKYIYPQPYENLGLRLLGSLLCLPFIFRHYWPGWAARLLPITFQLVVLYNIPFFFTYFMIRNDFNLIWVFSTVGAAFLLTMLVDWKTAAVMLGLGSLFWMSYGSAYKSTQDMAIYIQYSLIMLFPLLFGGIFNFKLQQYRKKQHEFEHRLRQMTNQNSAMMQEQTLLLSHFLSNTIVARLRQFQRKFDLNTAINLITRQEERFCAIMEADIRNFTKLFGRETELVVAQLINTCFTEITTIGQDLAVIKPVGDALFMYSDDQSGKEHTVNNILALAIFFANSIDEINNHLAERGEAPLNFGIAVHAGDAIYGNLASNTLIDPTIIGLNVNKTARMEELTKAPELQERVGLNAIIISDEVLETSQELIQQTALMEV